MSPMISSTKEKNKEIKMLRKNLQNNKDKLIKLREFVEKNFEYVGENFSKRVREIYYDNKNNKTIYGTTTQEERRKIEHRFS